MTTLRPVLFGIRKNSRNNPEIINQGYFHQFTQDAPGAIIEDLTGRIHIVFIQDFKFNDLHKDLPNVVDSIVRILFVKNGQPVYTETHSTGSMDKHRAYALVAKKRQEMPELKNMDAYVTIEDTFLITQEL